MSICPSKDLHSVFVDGELPEQFRQEYLSHINSCKQCKDEIQKLKNLKEELRKDSSSIFLSKNQIETGFAKLEQAMKFKKVTSVASHKLNFSQFMPMVTRLVPAVAAALIIALVLPIGLSRAFNTNSNSNELNEVAYISHILEPKNSLNVKDVLSNEQVSLIKTTENLKNVDLENIVTGNSSSNIYASVEDIINSSSSNFSNVYKSDKNLYNVAYSPFVGF